MIMSVEFSNQRETYNILLVEDSEPDMVLLSHRIRMKWPSSQITSAENLKNTSIALTKQDYDLILVDLNLPVTLGPQTVREVRQKAPQTPLIVITEVKCNMTVEECFKAGANHVTLKAEILSADFENILEEHIQE